MIGGVITYLLGMGLLHDLGMQYNTDKAYAHNYMNFYEKYFEPIRFEVKNLLEIGVWNGASINVWLEYFPNAHIYGIDIEPKPEVVAKDRFTYITVNALTEETTNLFNNNFFDIVIDDGSHKVSEQCAALKSYWKKIKPNGYFVMEDMHTSFLERHPLPYLQKLYVDIQPSTYDFLINKVDSDDADLNIIRSEFKNLHTFHNLEDVRESSVTTIIQK